MIQPQGVELEVVAGAVEGGALVAGALVVGAVLVGGTVGGGSLVGGSLVGGSLVGGSLVGGALVVGVVLVGGTVVGGSVVGGSLVGGSLVGGSLDRVGPVPGVLVSKVVDGTGLVGLVTVGEIETIGCSTLGVLPEPQPDPTMARTARPPTAIRAGLVFTEPPSSLGRQVWSNYGFGRTVQAEQDKAAFASNFAVLLLNPGEATYRACQHCVGLGPEALGVGGDELQRGAVRVAGRQLISKWRLNRRGEVRAERLKPFLHSLQVSELRDLERQVVEAGTAWVELARRGLVVLA
jgi:hypothetical protein